MLLTLTFSCPHIDMIQVETSLFLSYRDYLDRSHLSTGTVFGATSLESQVHHLYHIDCNYGSALDSANGVSVYLVFVLLSLIYKASCGCARGVVS